MRSLSLELRLAFIVVVLCLGASLAGAWMAGEIAERRFEQAGLSTLRSAADAFAAQERAEIEKLSATLDALLAHDDLRSAFVARDRARLLALATPLFETMRERDRITHWYFIEAEPSQAVFLRVHQPELRGDRVERATFLQAKATRDLGAGKELGLTAFALRAVRPWIVDGNVIGYVELAEEIDHFLTALKSRTGDEYGLLVKKRFLDEAAWAKVLGPRANTWNDRPDVVVVDTTTFTQGIIDYQGDLEALPDDGITLGEALREDTAVMRGLFPVRDASGRKVGGLFVLHDFTPQHAAARAAALQFRALLVGLGAVLAALVTLAMHFLIFARLRQLHRRLEREVTAAGLPPGRLIQLPDDEVSRLEALLDRVLFPSRGRDEPPRDVKPTSSRG
jgi:hypothetical protein